MKKSKRKQFKAVIQDEMFFEDLIWMSYRYCIGRRTIAASSHADNIAKYTHYLTHDRRQFMAEDIRREINSIIQFRKNVFIHGSNKKVDVLSLIYQYLMNHPEIEDDRSYTFNIYLDTETVEVELSPDKCTESLLDEWNDCVGWIKLANYLDEDSYKKIKVNYNEEEMELVGFSFPYIFQKNINILYTTPDQYLNRPFTNNHIAPEYIKEII